MPLLGFASDRPIGALPFYTLFSDFECTATIEAITNPIAELVQDPTKRLVISVQINNVPIGS